MQTKRQVSHLAGLAALLLVAACGSTLGGILGSAGQSDLSTIRGTVDSVDVADRRIDVDVDTVNNLVERRADSAIYYDDRTVVEYSGRSYEPDDLERGDEIQASGSQVQGRYVADTITVTSNVRTNDVTGRDDDWENDREVEVRGLVLQVDPRDRLIELDLDSGYDTRDRFVYFDERTRVEFEGRTTYTAANLERGDEIRVIGERRNGRLWASDVRVLRDARG